VKVYDSLLSLFGCGCNRRQAKTWLRTTPWHWVAAALSLYSVSDNEEKPVLEKATKSKSWKKTLVRYVVHYLILCSITFMLIQLLFQACPNSAKCVTFTCWLGNLRSEGAVEVQLNAIAWNSTFLEVSCILQSTDALLCLVIICGYRSTMAVLVWWSSHMLNLLSTAATWYIPTNQCSHLTLQQAFLQRR